MDGHGLKFEQIGQFFQSSKNPQEIYYGHPSLIKFVQHIRRSCTEAVCL